MTVEKKEGRVRNTKNVTVVDLPGIYSLSPYTSEEVVTRDFLLKERPDGIINILDATNIERNLYLTLQLIELNFPMVLALNMMDEVTSSGGSIDIKALEEKLGVAVVPISASKNQGISELISRAVKVAEQKILPKRLDFCSGEVHRAIHAVAHLIEDHAAAAGMPVRFAATKLVEGDQPTIDILKLNQNELDTLKHITDEMEAAARLDREAALADMRYSYITNLSAVCVHKAEETKEQRRSFVIDKALTHKYLAIPIFLGIMSVVFWLTFAVLGPFFSDILKTGISSFTEAADQWLSEIGLSLTVHSLIIDGIFAGVGSILSFLPIILVLFFLSFPLRGQRLYGKSSLCNG